jgi:hypothetical protein
MGAQRAIAPERGIVVLVSTLGVSFLPFCFGPLPERKIFLIRSRRTVPPTFRGALVANDAAPCSTPDGTLVKASPPRLRTEGGRVGQARRASVPLPAGRTEALLPNARRGVTVPFRMGS